MTDTDVVCAKGALALELEAAFTAFDFAKREIMGICQEIRHGDGTRAKKLAPAIAELGRCVTGILRECDKIDELRDYHGKLGREQPIDLGEARREVESRLARLRRARGGDGVSECPG